MELIVFAVIGGVVVFGAAAAVLYFNESARIRRALRAAPKRSIAEAGEGQVVRLDGTVADGDALTAPLTRRRCVFYEARIEQYVSSGKTGSWHVRAREARGVPFVLDDGSGRALIDPSGARLDVEIDWTTKSGVLDDPTPTEQEFLERHAIAGQSWVFNKQLRYREGAIEIGERIAVMGRPVREPDPGAANRVTGYRDGPPTRLRLGGTADHPLLISDARAVTRQ